MKQQIIELKKKLLLVELPEDLKFITVNNIKHFGFSSLVCENVKEQRLEHIDLIKGRDCNLITTNARLFTTVQNLFFTPAFRQ